MNTHDGMDNNEGLTSLAQRKAPQMVFIDTEVGIDSEKVHDYGAVRGDGAVLHTQSAQVFAAFVSECEVWCGHNIIRHDLKYLHLPGHHTIIDTLPLSPLLFPRKPYHRLVKDDKLLVDELNNPVNDAKKARDLFYDEVEAWRALPVTRRAIYQRLLSGAKEFRGFLEFVGAWARRGWTSRIFWRFQRFQKL
jgi:ATP-dependent DNA helicase RecQ